MGMEDWGCTLVRVSVSSWAYWEVDPKLDWEGGEMQLRFGYVHVPSVGEDEVTEVRMELDPLQRALGPCCS